MGKNDGFARSSVTFDPMATRGGGGRLPDDIPLRRGEVFKGNEPIHGATVAL